MAHDDTLVKETDIRRQKQVKKGKVSWSTLDVEEDDYDDFDDFDEVDYQRKKKARRTRRDREEE